MSETNDYLAATLIDGHPGYAVDQKGNVWSCWERSHRVRVGWHILKPQGTGKNRRHVYLGGGIKARKAYIGPLVLETFVGPRPPGHVAIYANGDVADNRLENLRWGHRSEVRGEHSNLAKLKTRDVEEIIRRIAAKEAHASIARRFGTTRNTIQLIAAGATWKHVPRPENMPQRRFVAESGTALTPYLENLVRFRIKRGDDRKTIARDFGISVLEVGRIERRN